jgi:hypothetical protein
VGAKRRGSGIKRLNNERSGTVDAVGEAVGRATHAHEVGGFQAMPAMTTSSSNSPAGLSW